jgi:hypothetical protein
VVDAKASRISLSSFASSGQICSKIRVCLIQFQIHCESKMFQFLSRNDSRSNQNHFVKSFGPFVETFQIQ